LVELKDDSTEFEELEDKFKASLNGPAMVNLLLICILRKTRLCTIAAAECERQRTEQGRQRGHHDRAEAQQTALVDRLARRGARCTRDRRASVVVAHPGQAMPSLFVKASTLKDSPISVGASSFCTADAAPAALYAGERLAAAFERTASRLVEMQSTDYLALEHLGG